MVLLPLQGLLGASWGLLTVTWGHLGASWERLGGLWVDPGGHVWSRTPQDNALRLFLVPSWGSLGALSRPLARSWKPLGSSGESVFGEPILGHTSAFHNAGTASRNWLVVYCDTCPVEVILGLYHDTKW